MVAYMTDSNRIEKKILLRAPKARVWRAITDVQEFGTWFHLTMEAPFEVGRSVKGRITKTGYEHLTLEVVVERMEPEKVFAYRWHPYATDPRIDYSNEPMTLVEFRLEDAPGGTMLTLSESGFDKIPAHRRAEAFRMNDGGWSEQVENIRRHVEA